MCCVLTSRDAQSQGVNLECYQAKEVNDDRSAYTCGTTINVACCTLLDVHTLVKGAYLRLADKTGGYGII